MAGHPLDEAATPYIDRTLVHLERELGPQAITPAFIAAFRRYPRHRFIDRYLGVGYRNRYDVGRGDVNQHLQRLYNTSPVPIVRDNDRAYVAGLSEVPSFELAARMLQMLAPSPGDRVLEIGSGSGWLLAMISHIVGPGGRVVGVELLPELAEASRQRLAALGCSAEVVTGDAGVALPPPEHFDRILISATIEDLPRTVFAAATEQSQLVAPVQMPGSTSRIYAWARRGAVFQAAASVSGRVVPLRGRLAADIDHVPTAESLPFADLLAGRPAGEQRCLGEEVTEEQRTQMLADFSTYLGVRFGRAYWWDGAFPGLEGTSRLLALYDRRSASAAVFGRRGLHGFGGTAALGMATAAWREWLAFGRPATRKFMLDIHPADAKPNASSTCWVHRHRDSVFVWRLR
jgi:protein-L-isoaspartate O-methyltransferase